MKAVVCGLAVGLASCATLSGVHSAELEVRRSIALQVEAWNRGDLAGFCDGYATDAIFVTPSGVTHGHAEVLSRYARKYGANRAGMGHLTLEPFDVRATETSVSVAATWTLQWPDAPTATGSTVFVFVKTPAGWRIVHDASM